MLRITYKTFQLLIFTLFFPIFTQIIFLNILIIKIFSYYHDL